MKTSLSEKKKDSKGRGGSEGREELILKFVLLLPNKIQGIQH